MLSGFHKWIGIVQEVACPGPRFCVFLCPLAPNTSSGFDHLLNGEPLLGSVYVLFCAGLTGMCLQVLTTCSMENPNWWHHCHLISWCHQLISLPQGEDQPLSCTQWWKYPWKYPEWTWHLYFTRPRKVLSPPEYCPPSGCLEETDCITRSTEELKSHRMNLYQWNRVDGKELAYKCIFLHLTMCSKVQRFRMTSLESFHMAT